MKTTKMLTILVLALVVGLPAGVANADFTFGTPTNLGPTVNSPYDDQLPSISADGLSLYFISDRPGGFGKRDIWVTTRETTDDPWGPPVNLGPTINTSSTDGGPSISADGLTLYFSRGGVADIWLTTRATTDDDWGNPVNLGPTVNSSVDECYPSISADGLALYFSSGPGRGGYGRYDLWVTTRETIHDPWGTPVNLGPTVNSSAFDVDPGISADGRALFFASNRSGGQGADDIWVTRRARTDDPWGEPVNLGSTVNSSGLDDFPNVSADGSTLFFCAGFSGRHSGGDIWQASIVPIVDFNGDGIVDIKDLVRLIEHWGQDEPSVDIGPMPWGDGIVDVADLEVLMSYWEQEILPVSLLAYWKLDETEGFIAQNSAGENDGTLYGDPLWQPTGGKVDGALAFDGTDDYISTDVVLNPADGPFSVFAWIKEGAPGQVIISQTNGAGTGRSWLCTGLSEGKLMTELKTLGRGRGPIVSEAVITDGNWHRIGFVWDGSYRYLYIDGAEVAKDTKSSSILESSDGGLYLGAGNTLDAAGFFSGLIDDVRIYDRAITP